MREEGDNEQREVGQPINVAKGKAENTTNTRRALTTESEKVTRYDNEYINSSNSGSYKDTSEGSSVDDARRHSSRKNNYDPKVPLKNFFIGFQFENLKLFKINLLSSQLRKYLSLFSKSTGQVF